MNLCPVSLIPALCLSAGFLMAPGQAIAAESAQMPETVTRWAHEGRPAKSDFNSAWLDLVRGGAMVSPEEGLSLSLILYNRMEDDLWVRVDFETPGKSQDCRQEAKLDAGMSYRFSCPQSSLVPGRRYTLAVSVFPNADYRSRLERKSTSYLFAAEEIEALENFRKQISEDVED